MKKIYKFLYVIIAMFIFSSCVLGCKGNEIEKKPPPKPKEDKEVVFADFEEWKPNFQTMRIPNGFGRIEWNSNKEYAKSGEHSARLRPVGFYSQGSKPYMYMPFSSKLFDFNYEDIQFIKDISFDIYNVQEQECKFSYGLVSEVYDVYTTKKVKIDEVTIKNGWTHIKYDVDIASLYFKLNLETVKGIYFEFDNSGTRDVVDEGEKKTPDYYLDDIKFTIRGKKLTYEDTIIPRIAPLADEIESFNDERSLNGVKVFGIGTDVLISWAETYEDVKDGVLLVKNNSLLQKSFPRFAIKPRQAKTAYSGYSSIEFNIFVKKGEDSQATTVPVVFFDGLYVDGVSICKTFDVTLNEWFTVTLPIASFMYAYDVVDCEESGWFFINNSAKNTFSELAISSIKAI